MFDEVPNMPLIHQWIIKIEVLDCQIHYDTKTLFLPILFTFLDP